MEEPRPGQLGDLFEGTRLGEQVGGPGDDIELPDAGKLIERLTVELEDDFVVAGGDVIYVHRMPMFYIYGEVQRAGSYRVERSMTIRQALAQAGSRPSFVRS